MDIKLYFAEKGCGEPLILLHGNGEDGTYFKNQIEYFSKSYRVIAIDTRGHGKSPRGTAPFNLSQFADDLYDFMNEENIDSANLLGFSDGGNIAIIFALRYPERVKKLILNGANLYTGGVKATVQIPVVIGYKIASFFKSEKAKRKSEILRLMVSDIGVKAEELSKIKIQTLVIVGKNDMIKESHTRLIFEALPNAQLAIIEGDHFIAAKNPDMFNKKVNEFLK